MTSMVTAKYDGNKNQIIDPNSQGSGGPLYPAYNSDGTLAGALDPKTGSTVSFGATRSSTLKNELGSVPVSLTGMGNSITAASTWLTRCCDVSGPRLKLISNKGLLGKDSDYLLNNITSSAVLDPTADVVSFGEGSNDAQHSYSTAWCYARKVAILQYILSKGQQPIFYKSPPVGTVATIPYMKYATWYSLMDHLIAEDIGVPLVDPWISVRGTNGDWAAGVSSDGVHPNPQYYLKAGEDMWSQLVPGTSSRPKMIPLCDNGYGGQSQYHNSGNTLMLAATAGLPTGWVRTGDATPVLTCVPSTYALGNKMNVVLTGITTPLTFYRDFSWAGDPKPAAGSKLRCVCVLGGTNLANVNIQVYANFQGDLTVQTIVSRSLSFTEEAFYLDLVTNNNTWTNGSIYMVITPTGTGSGTVTLSHCEIWDCTALRSSQAT